jgi:hypothetical protein
LPHNRVAVQTLYFPYSLLSFVGTIPVYGLRKRADRESDYDYYGCHPHLPISFYAYEPEKKPSNARINGRAQAAETIQVLDKNQAESAPVE